MPGFGHVINLNLIEGKGHQSESSHCHILDNISCMKRANTKCIIYVHLHMILRGKGEKMSIINNEQCKLLYIVIPSIPTIVSLQDHLEHTIEYIDGITGYDYNR